MLSKVDVESPRDGNCTDFVDFFLMTNLSLCELAKSLRITQNALLWNMLPPFLSTPFPVDLITKLCERRGRGCLEYIFPCRQSRWTFRRQVASKYPSVAALLSHARDPGVGWEQGVAAAAHLSGLPRSDALPLHEYNFPTFHRPLLSFHFTVIPITIIFTPFIWGRALFAGARWTTCDLPPHTSYLIWRGGTPRFTPYYMEWNYPFCVHGSAFLEDETLWLDGTICN